uniref:hypothetical protein n=1 Tax=Bacteroides uniformis TaxID=820 RepID=UPI00356672BE
IELFSYIDLLNYMLKYKIPQIVTLTHDLFLIVILADTENKKSSEILEFQSFALIYYLLSRCVRN